MEPIDSLLFESLSKEKNQQRWIPTKRWNTYPENVKPSTRLKYEKVESEFPNPLASATPVLSN